MGPPTGFAAVKQKLITKDDPLHVHKTLGILALASFFYRFSQFPYDTDLAFLSKPHLTLPTILLHFALNASSFEFFLPSRRINSGYRIWPEYRAHSLVFTCRSLASIGLTAYEWAYEVEPNYWLNLAIVLLTMAAADWSSKMCGDTYKSGFSRELDTPNYVKFFFSYMQFAATAACLYGLRRCSVHMIFIFIVQLNAFLMTMRRKNLGGHSLLIACYAIMLSVGFSIASYELVTHVGTYGIFMSFMGGFLGAAIRMGPRLPGPLQLLQGKYVLWTGIAALLNYIRPNDVNAEATMELTAATAASFVAMVCVAIYKSLYGYKKEPKEPTKAS